MNYIQHTEPSKSEDIKGGDLAINEDGALGVITGYRILQGIYIGVHASNDYALKGSEWESKNPRIIGCVDDAKAFAESLKDE